MDSSPGRKKPSRGKARQAVHPLPAGPCPSPAGCVETKPKRGGHAFRKKKSLYSA